MSNIVVLVYIFIMVCLFSFVVYANYKQNHKERRDQERYVRALRDCDDLLARCTKTVYKLPTQDFKKTERYKRQRKLED